MHSQGRVASEATRPNAGIDVSKEHLDVHLLELGMRVDNDASGWEALIAKLKESDVDLVVVEASGGYEHGLVTALHRARIDGDKFMAHGVFDGTKTVTDAFGGTGKYERMVRSGTSESPGPYPTAEAGTFTGCNHQTGTYKMK